MPVGEGRRPLLACLERMGSEASRRFYDVHVLADAEHELLAWDLIDTFVASEPEYMPDVLSGAACAITAEQRFTSRLLEEWQAIRPP